MYSEGLKHKKLGVRFAPGTKQDSSGSRALVFSKPRKPRSFDARQKWVELSQKHDFEKLRQEIESWQSRGLSLQTLFEEQGKTIVMMALLNAEDHLPLNFLCELVQKRGVHSDSIKDYFKSTVIKFFLLPESYAEETKSISPHKQFVRNEKIKLLVENIDGMKEMMEQACLTENVHENIKAAIQEATLALDTTSQPVL